MKTNLINFRDNFFIKFALFFLVILILSFLYNKSKQIDKLELEIIELERKLDDNYSDLEGRISDMEGRISDMEGY
jgi:hypothetical protein